MSLKDILSKLEDNNLKYLYVNEPKGPIKEIQFYLENDAFYKKGYLTVKPFKNNQWYVQQLYNHTFPPLNDVQLRLFVFLIEYLNSKGKDIYYEKEFADGYFSRA